MSSDELVHLLRRELRRRRDWLLHEQDAIALIRRDRRCSEAAAHQTLAQLVADGHVLRHRARIAATARTPRSRGWPPRREQDCYSLADAVGRTLVGAERAASA
jgi:hypothetical protein